MFCPPELDRPLLVRPAHADAGVEGGEPVLTLLREQVGAGVIVAAHPAIYVEQPRQPAVADFRGPGDAAGHNIFWRVRQILAGQQENKRFERALSSVRASVEGGSTLANAMRGFPKIFDDLTVNMVEAGETGGILDIILQRLAEYVEKAVKLRSAVRSALIYPVAVVSIAVIIVGALLKWVVPIFANLFVGLGVALPLPTRIVIGLSNFVGHFWWFFIAGAVALYFGVKQIRKDPRGRYFFDAVLLKLPAIGILLRISAEGRAGRNGPFAV